MFGEDFYLPHKRRFWASHFCVNGVVIQGLRDTKFVRRTALENSLGVQGRVLWQGPNLIQAWLATFICCFIL